MQCNEMQCSVVVRLVVCMFQVFYTTKATTIGFMDERERTLLGALALYSKTQVIATNNRICTK